MAYFDNMRLKGRIELALNLQFNCACNDESLLPAICTFRHHHTWHNLIHVHSIVESGICIVYVSSYVAHDV